MEIIINKQATINQIKEIDFDLSFYACGYEKRSTYIFSNVSIKCPQKNLLIFRNEHRLNFTNNLKCFRVDNFEEILVSGDSNSEIEKILDDFFKQTNKHDINILIDYSSMTNLWISTFLGYFKLFQSTNLNVHIFFVYSYACYNPPQTNNNLNISINPILNFCDISIPDKPTALVIGLGYEKNKAVGLSQYFDAESFIFITDKSYSGEYNKKVKSVNDDLLIDVDNENIFEYPVLNLDITSKILNSLTKDLLQTNRLVLAPCGPKPFSLLCLIESLRNNEVDVWRISSSKNKEAIDRIPDGNISIYQVNFCSA